MERTDDETSALRAIVAAPTLAESTALTHAFLCHPSGEACPGCLCVPDARRLALYHSPLCK